MTAHCIEQPRYPGPCQDRRLCVPALLLVCRGSDAVCQRLCSSVSADRLKIMRGRPSHGRTMGANQRGVTRGAQGAGCPAGSDNRHYGNFAGLDFAGVARDAGC